MTSVVTSSPRCAGRQWRKIALGSASFISSASTVYPLKARRRTSASCTCPIDAHTSVLDRKSTRLNSSHGYISYAVFCLKKKKNNQERQRSQHRGTQHV